MSVKKYQLIDLIGKRYVVDIISPWKMDDRIVYTVVRDRSMIPDRID